MPIPITDPSRLAEILNTFSALDDVRWAGSSNYSLINHCAQDLTPDEILLTHWISYVTDRQTAFERVWDVGGYVHPCEPDTCSFKQDKLRAACRSGIGITKRTGCALPDGSMA